MNRCYPSIVEVEGEEAFIPLPEEIISELNLKEGDMVEVRFVSLDELSCSGQEDTDSNSTS